jgi:hypothetical protein
MTINKLLYVDGSHITNLHGLRMQGYVPGRQRQADYGRPNRRGYLTIRKGVYE